VMKDCRWCGARYSHGGWCSCRDQTERGSTANPVYRVTGKIPDDVCPMCRKPDNLAPRPHVQAM